MNTLLERLETVEKRYDELTQILMDPSIANDVSKMTAASKEQASLEKAYNMCQEYKSLLDGIEEAKELLKESDPEIREMAKEEYETLLADAEVGRGTVKKDRYCIVYKDKYFELDVYPIWRDRALLEIELSREDEEFELPDFLDVIREVTPEDEYKNYNIAKLFDKR